MPHGLDIQHQGLGVCATEMSNEISLIKQQWEFGARTLTSILKIWPKYYHCQRHSLTHTHTFAESQTPWQKSFFQNLGHTFLEE